MQTGLPGCHIYTVLLLREDTVSFVLPVFLYFALLNAIVEMYSSAENNLFCKHSLYDVAYFIFLDAWLLGVQVCCKCSDSAGIILYSGVFLCICLKNMVLINTRQNTRQHRRGRKENTTSRQDRPPIKE